MKRKIVKNMKMLVSIVLACLVLATTVLNNATVVMADEVKHTFEVGSDGRSVIAELGSDGILCLTGSGRMMNYTAETAPFAEHAGEIKGIEIGGGITSIGDYAFYGLYGIRDTVEIGNAIEYIGTEAFSGRTLETSPNPLYIINTFKEKQIAKLKSEEEQDSKYDGDKTDVIGKDNSSDEYITEEELASNLITEKNNTGEEEAREITEAEVNSEPKDENAGTEFSGEAYGESDKIDSSTAPESTLELDNKDSNFELVTITEQELGSNIFYPAEYSKAYFTAEDSNISFIDVMESLGYIRAEGVAEIVFDCGSGASLEGENLLKSVPIINGVIILPDIPAQFSAPSEDEIFKYSFAGWTESQDSPGEVRRPGSEYQTENRTDLYFVASWNKETKISINVTHSRADEISSTIFEIAPIESYAINSVVWQACDNPGYIDGYGTCEEEYPWYDIQGENETVYIREDEEGDSARIFRAVITIEKQTLMRSFFALFSTPAGGEEITLSAVNGLSGFLSETTDGPMISFDPGTNGIGNMAPVPWNQNGDEFIVPLCDFTANNSTQTFGGWVGNDGNDYDPGDVIVISEDFTFTAKWVTYNPPQIVTSQSGLAAAYAALPDDGTIYTNFIVLQTQVDSISQMPDKQATITAKHPGETNVNDSGAFRVPDWQTCFINAPVRFENVKFMTGQHYTGINFFACENRVTMGRGITGVTQSGTYPAIAGSHLNNPSDRNVDLRVFSGTYSQIAGATTPWASSKGEISVVIAGGTVEGSVYATSLNVNAIEGNTKIRIADTNSDAPTWIKENVYAGGNVAVAKKDTFLGISGGRIGGSIFGGGIGAAVNGNATVKVSGGTINGSVFGGGDQADGNVGGTTNVRITGGTIVGNIYGGGNLGAVSGKSSLEILGNAIIRGDVNGGGKNATVGGASIKISDGEIEKNLYGGGEGLGATVNSGTALVDMAGGRVKGNLFGGGDQGNVPASQVKISGTAQVDMSVYGGGNLATVPSASIEITGGTVGSVYGGGLNGNVTDSASVSIENGVVTGSVYGGGENGTVENTSLTLKNSEVADNIFGGGKTAAVTSGTVLVTLTGTTVLGSVYGGGENGTVSDAIVKVLSGSEVGNIYGGGKSAELSTTRVEVTDSIVTGNVYGGGEDADIVSTATAISGSTVNGTVYGGGDAAHITSTSIVPKVTVSNSNVTGDIFGGGNAGNIEASTEVQLINANRITGNVYGGGNEGYVAGNAAVNVCGGYTGSVFGGGRKGEVRGTSGSSVSVTGGTIKGDAYGGGSEGAVPNGNSIVTLSAGIIQQTVFGGSMGSSEDASVGRVGGSASVIINGGYIGTIGGSGGVNSGAVFGGGRFAETVGNSSVTLDGTAGTVETAYSVIGGAYYAGVNHSSVTITGNVTIGGTVFGGGYGVREAQSFGSAVTINGGTISQDVYGGGAMGIVRGDVTVNISEGTVGGSVFGAGQGSASAPREGSDENFGDVYGDVSVFLIGGHVTGFVYGGGNYGNIGKGTFTVNSEGNIRNMTNTGEAYEASVIIDGAVIDGYVYGGGSGAIGAAGSMLYGATYGSTSINILSGSIGKTIYGGSNRSYVSGDTYIQIAPKNSGLITISGSVYGGGNLSSEVGKPYDSDVILVFGTARMVLDDSNQSKAASTTIGGSVLASGNMTTVAGSLSTVIVIKDFNGTLQSLQRTHNVYIINSKIRLTGENDVTEEVIRSYSLSRILGDLAIVDGSEITIDMVVRMMGGLSSKRYTGEVPTVKSFTGYLETYMNPANYVIDTSATENRGNTLHVYQGRVIQLIDENGIYSPINGKFRLGILSDESGDFGITIQGSYMENEAARDAVFVKSQSSMVDKDIESGSTNTAYSWWRLGSNTTVLNYSMLAKNYEKEPTYVDGSSGMAYVEQEAMLVTSPKRTVFVAESVTFTETEDGSFKIIAPGTDISDANAGSEFALGIAAIEDDSWEDIGGDNYFTSPPGQAHINGGYPITSVGSGNGPIKFKLWYNPKFDKFTSGIVHITLKEYSYSGESPLQADFIEENLEQTVIFNLSIDGEVGTGVLHKAAAKEGLTFKNIMDSTDNVIVTNQSAVTAQFDSRYYPESTGSIGINLLLLKKTGDTYSEVYFPVGTQIIMSDMINPSSVVYYSEKITASATVSLNMFTKLGIGSNSIYSGPRDNTVRTEESLLFGVDFSGAETLLEPGNYALFLRHSQSEDYNEMDSLACFSLVAPSDIPVTIEASGEENTVFTITNNAVPADRRFDFGMGTKLTMYENDGVTVRKIPVETSVKVISGNAKVYRNTDATITVHMISQTAAIEMDFTNTAVSTGSVYKMVPSLPDLGFTGEELSFTVGGSGSGSEEPSVSSIKVSLAEPDDNARLIEVPEAGKSTMAMSLNMSGMESGDTVRVTVYQKNGSKYVKYTNTALVDCIITGVTSTGATATAEIKPGAASGTYRLEFEVVSQKGIVKSAEPAPFNFIIK